MVFVPKFVSSQKSDFDSTRLGPRLVDACDMTSVMASCAWTAVTARRAAGHTTRARGRSSGCRCQLHAEFGFVPTPGPMRTCASHNRCCTENESLCILAETPAGFNAQPAIETGRSLECDGTQSRVPEGHQSSRSAALR